MGGTLTESYDGLDRLVGEASPNGSVSYQYDTASRRTQMTVAGQGAVTYGYDNADRLTGITQGSQSVAVGYDNANRRTTLPNGIKLSYGFDNANELTGLTYKLGASTVGTMTYGYDSDGRIISRGGTFDVTNLPAAVASAVYDANNRLTNWGGQILNYDADGNLVSNGTSTFTWNTRNQLMGISGGSTASFVYDALGQRESKTISSTPTNFLYDGLNNVQELSGTTPTVNYLTGAGIDETLSRTDSSGIESYLNDNLGSTLALTSSAGAISTSYSYEPYGNTSATGTTSANALQYTGRENDGDGLYYYQARYYSPTYGRFISSDPIGLLGGINTYAYALGSPVNFNDPFGLNPWDQFQLPGGLNQQDLQSLAAEQSVENQLRAAQYQATKLEFEAAQCITMEIIHNYHSVFPGQKEIGPIEAFSSSIPLGTVHTGLEITTAAGAHVYENAAAMGGPEAAAFEARAAGFWLVEVAMAVGAIEDAADIVADTYVTVTTSRCCSIH